VSSANFNILLLTESSMSLTVKHDIIQTKGYMSLDW